MWAFIATYASCLLWLLKHSVRRRNQPATVDEMKRLNISLVLHGPTVVHLHPTRIPDNSGAAARRIRSGLAFTVFSNGENTLMAKQDRVWATVLSLSS